VTLEAVRRLTGAERDRVAGGLQVPGDRERVEVIPVDVGDQHGVHAGERAAGRLERLAPGARHPRVLGQTVAEQRVHQDLRAARREEEPLVGQVRDLDAPGVAPIRARVPAGARRGSRVALAARPGGCDRILAPARPGGRRGGEAGQQEDRGARTRPGHPIGSQ
jgi:hypothetical protein